MIPKVIHYCWFGGNPLNDMAKKCIESWKKYCPDYEIVEWNESNFDIGTSCDYVKEAYEAKKWAFVSDYVRLWAIYNYGGIYLDVDVELIKSIDFLRKNKAFFGFEDDNNIATGVGFGAEKDNDVVKELINDYNNIHFKNSDGKFDLTPCPSRNTRIFKKWGFEGNGKKQIVNGNVVYPKDYFCPKDYNTNILNITENTVSIHHFNASWYDNFTKLLHDKRIEFRETYGDNWQLKFDEWYKKNSIVIHIKYFGIKATAKKIWSKIIG